MKLFTKIKLLLLFQAKFSMCWTISPVIKKTLLIADSSFDYNFATTIVWFTDLQKVTDFIENFKGSVVLTPMQSGTLEEVRDTNVKIGYKQTVFFATGVDEFAKFMTMLKIVIVVPIRLILVLTEPNTDAEISLITKTAWENDLADIIILSTDEEEIVKLTTYYPYSKGICGNHFPVQIKPEPGQIWFPNKFFNFQGCPIRVTLLHMIPYSYLTIVNGTVESLGGLDGQIFDILISHMNASIDKILCRNQNTVGTVINGTPTGCFGDLMYNRVDMFFPTLVVDTARYPVAQISNIFEYLELIWCGPPQRPIEQWLKILHPFMTDTTRAIVIAFIFFVITIHVVIRYGVYRLNFKFNVTFESFKMFLGQDVKFETKSWLLNTLFVKWIWFCMIVRIVYQGDLIDGLQTNELEKPLILMEDAIKEVDNYGGLEVAHIFFMGTRYYEGYKVLNLPDARANIRKVSDGKRFLTTSTKVLAFELGSNLQLLKDPIYIAPLCFFMRPGWPASKDINTVTMRIAASGFPQKVLSDSAYKWKKKQQHYEDREAHALNMNTLIGCFYGLGVLYIICVLVFIAELVYYKHTLKHQKHKFF